MEVNKMTVTELYEFKLIEPFTTKILGLDNSIEQLYKKLNDTVQAEYGNQSFDLNKKLNSYWKLVAYRDCLNRLKVLLKQNFNYIESMSLLAVTRYVFELTVWVKLIQKDEKYGYYYYHELITDKKNYFKMLKEHFNHEIEFLEGVAREEQQLEDRLLHEALKISDLELQKEAFSQLNRNIEREIDEKASRKFSIYSEEAQTNGYVFQADLIKTKILPDIEKYISDLETEDNQFDHDDSTSKRIPPYKRWNWKDQVKYVDMEDEYNFIYSYTSKLLHAIPMSLTTNQKNLEVSEVRIFLKYIYVRLLDVIEITKQLLLTKETNN